MGEPRATVGCPRCGDECAPGVRFCSNCGHSFSGLELSAAGAAEVVPSGTVIGNYRVLDLLGEGGMGRVYVGEHIRLGRRVAIKILRSEFSSNPVAISRFFAEARAVNVISHQHIVQITDFIEREGGRNCIIMELLRGEDLGVRLHREPILAMPVALDISAQIANGLTAAHRAHIIHRDLKPDNVFLTEHPDRLNFVKLLDFGVAKLSSPGGDALAMHTTAAGQIIGTPEYMSPEQAAGRAIDHRTDIYACGAILYQMVTGHLPFVADNFGELIIKHMSETPKPPSSYSDLPHAISGAEENLILDMLARDPERRPSTMLEVEARIRELLDDSVRAITPRGSGPTAKPAKMGALSPTGSGPTVVKKKLTTGNMRPISPAGSGPNTRTPSGPRMGEAMAPTVDAAGEAAKALPITGAIRVRQPSGDTAPVSEPAVVSEPAEVSEPVAPLPPAPTRRLSAPRWLLIATACAVVLVAIVAFAKLGSSSHRRAARPAAEQPAPVVTPPPVDEIKIKFSSQPPGATVRIVGQKEILGTTPFSHRFARSDEPIVFEFERMGYNTLTEEISVDADGSFTAALSRLPRVLGPSH